MESASLHSNNSVVWSRKTQWLLWCSSTHQRSTATAQCRAWRETPQTLPATVPVWLPEYPVHQNQFIQTLSADIDKVHVDKFHKASGRKPKKDFTYQMVSICNTSTEQVSYKTHVSTAKKTFLCSFHPLTHYTWHNSCYHSRSDWWMKACDYLVVHIKPCCFLESYFINGEVNMVKDSFIYRLSIPPSQLWKGSLGGFHTWYSANIGVTGRLGSSVCPPGTPNHLVLASSTHTLMIIQWWTLVASPH